MKINRRGQKFLFLYNYYDSISSVTGSNFTCDIKPQYLSIVENYPHLVRKGMRQVKKQSALNEAEFLFSKLNTNQPCEC